MTRGRSGKRSVLVVNPLNNYALLHYEKELLATLDRQDEYQVELADTVAGDGISGRAHRVAVAAKTLRQRYNLARRVRGQTVVVTWPLFGYLDPLTLIPLARRNDVYLIVHDPSPLRRTYGQFHLARVLFGMAVRHWNLRVLYHTEHAREVGVRETGVSGTVVPHPVLPGLSQAPIRHISRRSRPVVRVLGAYKQTRSLTALAAIAQGAGGSCELEIYGRGWPPVDGWKVEDRFVPEQEFADLVESSDCVVIPYDLFFQSGVAARCLEEGIPVVAPRHEHIAQLFGDDWAGMVGDESDWYDALVRVLDMPEGCVASRREHVARQIQVAWHELIGQPPPQGG